MKHYCLHCRKDTLHHLVTRTELHGLPAAELECKFCQKHTIAFMTAARETELKASTEKATR